MKYLITGTSDLKVPSEAITNDCNETIIDTEQPDIILIQSLVYPGKDIFSGLSAAVSNHQIKRKTYDDSVFELMMIQCLSLIHILIILFN